MLTALLLACTTDPVAPTPEVAAPFTHPASGDCAGCHAAEAAAWARSNHAHASGTDLHPERFSGDPISLGALRVTPTLIEGAPSFKIRDGAGERTWTVTGTIGVAPLQQYLLADVRGRTLVAPVAWNVASGAWFDPAPGGAVGDPADALYWAGMAGNWNHLCGECHTTAFAKGYDATTDHYTSVAAHPAVSCEACHGTEALALDTASTQVRACMPCHSRHDTIGYGTTPTSELLDTQRPAVLGSLVFAADGRNNSPDEPFEWGAYAQSGMYAAGIRCSDCHDPHTGRTRAEGDAVCTGCHADVRASHPDQTVATGCIGCHMPTQNYMVIDARHDHGMHGPGPTALGTTWTAGLNGDPAVAPALLALALDGTQSSFVRASAAALLRRGPPTGASRLRTLLFDPDASLRVEVVDTLAAWGDVPASALTDRARGVRFAAFKGIVAMGAPVALRTPAFEAVRSEFEAAARAQGDLASSWQNVAVVRSALGDIPGTVTALEQVLARDPANEPVRRALEALRSKK